MNMIKLKNVISVQFILMGNEEAAINSISKIPTERVQIFVSKAYRQKATKVKHHFEKNHRIHSEVNIIDMLNISDCVTNILSAYAKERTHAVENEFKLRLALNMTAGTNIMSSSMVLSAYILSGMIDPGKDLVVEEINLYYIASMVTLNPELEAEDDRLVTVPLPRVFMKDLDEKKKKVFLKIKENPGITLKDLKDEAGFRHTSSLKRHSDKLEEYGIVSGNYVGREKHVYLTSSGHLLASLMDINI